MAGLGHGRPGSWQAWVMAGLGHGSRPGSWQAWVMAGLGHGRPGASSAHSLTRHTCCLTANTHHKPMCNGLSQFREDTGGSSIPVQEFNLTARPLDQPKLKNSVQTWI